MTYARARRKAQRDHTLTHLRCLNCWHLNLPEHAPFCSGFCMDAWTRRNLRGD